MKVTVLGATGFIGRALVLALQGRGDVVRVLARSPKRAAAVLPAGVDVASFADDVATRAAVADADAVINLAGESIASKRWTRARKRALYASRIETTGKLVAALEARRRRLPVLVSASATGWYGDRGDDELDDRSPAGDGFAAELCRAWEAAADEANASRIVHARFGVVLGREGGALAKLLPIFRLRAGGPIGGGAQWMAWIHLDDAVAALLAMLDEPRLRGPVAVVAPPVRQRVFAKALGHALDRAAVLPTPALAVKAVLGEAASILLASQRVMPRALGAAGFEHRFPTIDDALADLVEDGVTIERSAALPDEAYVRERRPRYTLRARTELDAPLADVFAFFSSPENLAALTPPGLAFEITTPRPIAVGAGTLIDYRIRVAGIPMRWRTRIEHFDGASFVDSQLRGPYRAWWHEHRFVASASGGTIMEDIVHYAPPLGPLGAIANRLFVERMLRRIFGYRRQAIRIRFAARARPLNVARA